MATPHLTRHTLPGALGEVFVDVRTASPTVSQPAIVFHHGFGGHKDYAFIPVFAERAARAGFTAVTLTVSGSGVDAEGNVVHLDRFAINSYSREMDDLAAVVRAVRDGSLGVAPPTSIGMVAHSRGATMALCLARETPEIAALVTWAGMGKARRHTDADLAFWRKLGTIMIQHPRLKVDVPFNIEVADDYFRFAETRFNVDEAARTLGRPWLLIHGTGDTTIPIAEALELAAAGAGPRLEVLYLDEAQHAFGATHPWSGPTADTERVFDSTLRFLTRHLP